jgi:hypothetical protein
MRAGVEEKFSWLRSGCHFPGPEVSRWMWPRLKFSSQRVETRPSLYSMQLCLPSEWKMFGNIFAYTVSLRSWERLLSWTDFVERIFVMWIAVSDGQNVTAECFVSERSRALHPKMRGKKRNVVVLSETYKRRKHIELCCDIRHSVMLRNANNVFLFNENTYRKQKWQNTPFVCLLYFLLLLWLVLVLWAETKNSLFCWGGGGCCSERISDERVHIRVTSLTLRYGWSNPLMLMFRKARTLPVSRLLHVYVRSTGGALICQIIRHRVVGWSLNS